MAHAAQGSGDPALLAAGKRLEVVHRRILSGLIEV